MTSDFVERRLPDIATAFALALVVFAVSRAYALPLVGLHHDDGQYVVAAKALATGEGYRQIHVPGHPAQAKIPVLFPALLAALWWLRPAFPANVPLFTTACSASLALAALLALLAARRRLGLTVAEACAWILAGFTMPALAGLCARVMSEGPFLLFLVAALWALASASERDRGWWVAGIALGLCVLTRSIGVFVLAGAVAWCAWSRRWRTGLLLPAIGMSCAWFAWSWQAQSASRAPDLYGASYQAWLSTVPIAAWPAVVGDNVLALFVHTGHLLVQPVMSVLPVASRPQAALVVGLVVVGASAVSAWRVGGPWPWVLGTYATAAIVWPWPPSRFVIVVLPLTLLLVAAAAAGRRMARPAAAIASVLALSNGVYAVGAWPKAHGASLVLTGSPPARWSDYDAMFAWIRAGTAPGAIVASVSEPMVYLYAGREGVFPYRQATIAINYTEPPSIGSAADLDRLLDRSGADYLVRMPAPTWGHSEMLDAVIADLRHARPNRLQRAWAAPDDPRFEVLEVLKESTP